MSGFKTIPRRRFLQGLGAAMALPMLDGMVPARAATAATPPVRAAFVFFPNGAIMPSWKPTGADTDFELSQTLKPLEPFRSELNIFTGLAQDNGRAKGDGPGDHARCAASYLTGAHPVKTSGSNIKVGVSVDQVAAQQIGKRTRLPSLEIGIALKICEEYGGLFKSVSTPEIFRTYLDLRKRRNVLILFLPGK